MENTGRQFGVYMNYEQVQKIEDRRGAVTRSTFMRNLLTLALQDEALILRALDGDL